MLFNYVIAEQLQLPADQSTYCTCAHLSSMKYHASLPTTHNKVCQKKYRLMTWMHIFQSLTLKYRQNIESIDSLTEPL